jgi:cytochrome c556
MRHHLNRNALMKTNKFALFAILLWVATALVFGWFFVRGNTTSGTDKRTAIMLQAGERELVLAEMRGLLSASQGILDGINRNDMKQVAQAARAAGMGSAADVNPVLMGKLPIEFKKLGMSVHHSMDEIAAAAEAGKPGNEILGKLSATMASCVACHATWQLQAEK